MRRDWEGDTHTLIVHTVTLPDGPLDDEAGTYKIRAAGARSTGPNAATSTTAAWSSSMTPRSETSTEEKQ